MRPIMPNIEAPVAVIETDRDQMRRGLLSTGGWSVAMATENVASLPDTDGALQMLARHRIEQGYERIAREQYPEIIQAARWMDEDHGTPHFEPGVGFIVDDPDGLAVPVRWIPYLSKIETALANLDHLNPHPLDAETIEWLTREGKQSTIFESAVHCFISGEHTPVTAMAESSEELFVANRFFNERFEGWQFDATIGRVVTIDDVDSPAARVEYARTCFTAILEKPEEAKALARAGLDLCNLTAAQRAKMRGDA